MAKHESPWIDLKKLREGNGWLQNETAEKLGFCKSYISSLETGKKGFSKKMMKMIIKVFNVKYEDFYSNDE